MPHDLGTPHEAPLKRANAFAFTDPNAWRDLAPKFALLLHRAWRTHANPPLSLDALKRTLWPAARAALAPLFQAADRDGLPRFRSHNGTTFDWYRWRGLDAYSGVLWLASLQACGEVALAAGDSESAATCQRALAKAAPALLRRLWREPEQFLLADEGGAGDDDETLVVFAAQTVGMASLALVGSAPILPTRIEEAALATVFATNVRAFAERINGGEGRTAYGAVNAALWGSGVPPATNLQSGEVWTGVSYLLAAHLACAGRAADAATTAQGVYNATWLRGLPFRTPEAIDETLRFRAALYMRPLSVWAIEHAFSGPCAARTRGREKTIPAKDAEL